VDALHPFSSNVTNDDEEVTDGAGNEAGRHPGRGEVSPLPSRPNFPRVTGNDDRGGSTIAVLEHKLSP
jgi:hypothetical protein